MSSITNNEFDATENCLFADVAVSIRFRMRVDKRISLRNIFVRLDPYMRKRLVGTL